MVGWIKMPLGIEVGLSPGDMVLDEDPAPHTERGTAAHKYGLHFTDAGTLIVAHVYCGETVGHLSNC